MGSRKRHRDDIVNDYAGYRLTKNSNPRDFIVSNTPNSKEFYEKFVSQRKPCVIQGHFGPETDSVGPPWTLTKNMLLEAAENELVQVERRLSADESFGQARTQERQEVMTLGGFLNLSKEVASMYYLSTQTDNSSDDVLTHISTPCKQLMQQGRIPSRLLVAGNLVLHSCHLWMGVAAASSGLHHDFHDNIYVLLKGAKKFRLYSPDSAQHMYVHGKIDFIHANGLLSYQGRETRQDGVPWSLIHQDKDNQKDQSSNDDDDKEEDEEEDEEEEIVFGKGADYASTDDEVDWDEMGTDDFDKLVESESATKDSDSDSENENDNPPPSFSRITPQQLYGDPKQLTKMYPDFATCPSVTIELKAGQTLFLPAGWFHEVSSSANSSDLCHMAINYWYYPPDNLSSFEKPYQDDYLISHNLRIPEKIESVKNK